MKLNQQKNNNGHNFKYKDFIYSSFILFLKKINCFCKLYINRHYK